MSVRSHLALVKYTIFIAIVVLLVQTSCRTHRLCPFRFSFRERKRTLLSSLPSHVRVRAYTRQADWLSGHRFTACLAYVQLSLSVYLLLPIKRASDSSCCVFVCACCATQLPCSISYLCAVCERPPSVAGFLIDSIAILHVCCIMKADACSHILTSHGSLLCAYLHP